MRRKKVTTRRQAALRWVICVVFLLLLLLWLGARSFTPKAANRQELKLLLTDPVIPVCQIAEPEDNQLVLSWNDDVVCLGAYHPYRFLEWTCRSREIAQREEGRPFTAGANQVHLAEGDDDRDTRWDSYYYIFGRVEDSAVETLEVEFKGYEGDDGPNDPTLRKTETLLVDEMEEYQNKAWFIYAIELGTSIASRSCEITAYDAEGNRLGTYQVIGTPRWE
jgi:hypothetical protein